MSTGALTNEQAEILAAAQTPRTLAELMAVTKLRHRTNFSRNYLQPLIESGRLRMTAPDQPKSRQQRYVAVPPPREETPPKGEWPSRGTKSRDQVAADDGKVPTSAGSTNLGPQSTNLGPAAQ